MHQSLAKAQSIGSFVGILFLKGHGFALGIEVG
jgi:hypothetical protein